MLPEVTLQWRTELFDVVAHLHGELAGRSQHQHARPRPFTVEGVSSFCRAGSTKAAVLPVPVWAEAMRSRPSSATGIARAEWRSVPCSDRP